nr:hypothetical protein [Nitrosomonas eutropha]
MAGKIPAIMEELRAQTQYQLAIYPPGTFSTIAPEEHKQILVTFP